jgi:hypothetical protein
MVFIIGVDEEDFDEEGYMRLESDVMAALDWVEERRERLGDTWSHEEESEEHSDGGFAEYAREYGTAYE